ncbi:MAG TPA: molecular chaperone DnaJ [Candidatus Gastranaerophilaceae bacterium]|nr:molecular chaperone DnaJ [Candidatus Gastranaerophilaceae bacterium]
MDYYEILGVSKNAEKDEIKAAFRKKAREYHPDVNKAHDAEQKFKELGKAYETLMDDDKRSLYDRYGEDGLKNAGFGSEGPFAGGFGDLNDIFNSFFGGFGFSQGYSDPNAPQRGDDLRVDIELTFEEAVFGITKEIKIDHLEICGECKGTGAEPGSKPITCPTCHGSGKIQQTTQTILGHFTQITTCPDCHGLGQKINSPCKACKGYGRIEKEKTVELKIPAGVDNGSKMRISQEGDAGKNGGPSGDLYVVIRVKPSDYLKREGINVFSEIEISPSQAVLGDEVVVKTLDGEKQISIPAGIQSASPIRIKSAGVPHLGKSSQRGEHIIIVNVKTPTNLSEEEKQLYKKLYEINTKKKYQEGLFDKVKGWGVNK